MGKSWKAVLASLNELSWLDWLFVCSVI